jgi:hypothetical protein
MRARIIALLVFAFALTPGLVFAQNASVEFNRWDAQITPSANSSQMQVAELQEVHVTNGTVSHGQRFWTSPVQLQNVYLISGNDSTPRQLTQGSSNQPGSYKLTQSGNQTTLDYTLPAAVSAGSTFTVQINYTATSPTTGMVDWKIVPAEHNFTVKSSTVRITFPSGQAPDPSLVRASQSTANVQMNGNEMIITSAGPIAPQQAFSIQVPFGAGVGAAGNSDNSGQTNPNGNPALPPQNQPDNGTQIQLPGIGTILLIVCIVGLLLLFGGGSLLRSLLGGFLGGGSSSGNQGPFGGGGFGGNQGGPFGGGSNQGPVQRGFRPSSNQNRDVPNVGNDKDSGGGASFG